MLDNYGKCREPWDEQNNHGGKARFPFENDVPPILSIHMYLFVGKGLYIV